MATSYFIDRDGQPVRVVDGRSPEILLPSGEWKTWPVDMYHDATPVDLPAVRAAAKRWCDGAPVSFAR